MKEFKTKIDKFDLKKVQQEFPRAKITRSRDAYEFISQFYGDDIDVYESFFILLLNNSNNTIGFAKISQGGITGTLVDVKIIAKYCIDSLATGVILAHNHPSGKLRPSNADINVTKKVQKALELIDTKVLDHVIITTNSYYSFADEGDL